MRSLKRCLNTTLLLPLMVALAFAASPTVAQSTRPDEGERRQGERLRVEARDLDADAAKATATPAGQRRVTETIAKQFKVQDSVVTSLRSRRMGYGEITTALALSQELMKRDKSLTQQHALDTILAKRAGGEGWGKIAHELGLKLGDVVSEVHKADKRVDHIAKVENGEKHDKADKVEKADKAEKPDKVEKPEKPMRAERPGR